MRTLLFGGSSLVCAFALLTACGPSGGRRNGNGNGNGNDKPDLSVPGGGSKDMAVGGSPDQSGVTLDLTGACGKQTFKLEKAGPPNLLLVLDRSGSMGTGPGSTWVEITTAINTVVGQLQGEIKWGLEYFPTDNSCGVSATVAVEVGNDTADAIAMSITMNEPTDGSTPTAEAVRKGANYLAALSDPNPKFIVLATDGAPNCDSPGTSGSQVCTCTAPFTQQGTNCCFGPACIPCSFLPSADSGAGEAVVEAANKGINTFVIGLATGSGEAAVLNDLATKGKTARPGNPKYYEASNQTDFVNAINAIGKQIVSCTLALTAAPLVPDYSEVKAEGSVVPRDTTHAEGWDYGPNNTSIIFYGSYCDQLQAGTIKDVDATFSCEPIS